MRIADHESGPGALANLMATIDALTTPLVLRHPDGREQLIAACFRHPLGLLYFDLYWHQSTPRESAHLIRGVVHGDGPWRIGDKRLRTLGCRNTDPHLQDDFSAWQQHIDAHPGAYPARQQIIEIARRLGASPQARPAHQSPAGHLRPT